MINNKYVILCLYVNGILIFGTKLEDILIVKDYLSKKFDMKDLEEVDMTLGMKIFDMKDLGEADMILGMKISSTPKGITLSLSHSIEKMLVLISLNFLLGVPLMNSKMLKKNEVELVFHLKYSQLIGSLLYVSNRTRPDIAYIVCRLSRFIHEYPNVIKGYRDANWITDSDSKIYFRICFPSWWWCCVMRLCKQIVIA